MRPYVDYVVPKNPRVREKEKDTLTCLIMNEEYASKAAEERMRGSPIASVSVIIRSKCSTYAPIASQNEFIVPGDYIR